MVLIMARKTIWIAGSQGKAGSVLYSVLRKNQNYKVVGTGRDIDITDIKAVDQAMDIYRPNIVINCASVSDADYCEKNRIEAYRVNTLGARNLASVTARYNVKIIHLSTDQVFSGERNAPKNEFDVPTPKTVFGKSKYAGENYVKELNEKHLIIRSSWVYGTGQDSYYDYVLECAKANRPFKAPMDVISTPTNVRDIARVIELLIDSREYGVFHVSAEGACTLLEYARAVLRLNDYDPLLAEGTVRATDGHTTSTFLENLMLEMTGIAKMPDWYEALEKYVAGSKEK